MSDAYDIEMKVGDTRTISVTLLDGNGVALNLTGKTVAFRLREVGAETPLVNDAAATVVDAAAGKVSYDHTAAQAGAFKFEFRATTVATGKIETYPGNGYKTLRVHERA